MIMGKMPIVLHVQASVDDLVFEMRVFVQNHLSSVTRTEEGEQPLPELEDPRPKGKESHNQ